MLKTGGKRHMILSLRTWSLILVALFSLLLPDMLAAREEKPASLEAVLEELAALRALVEDQQRQIQELRASVQPTGSAVRALPIAQTPPSTEDLTKRVDTLSTNLAGFKLSG